MGTGGSSLPSSPLWLYISVSLYIYLFVALSPFTEVLALVFLKEDLQLHSKAYYSVFFLFESVKILVSLD